MPIVHPDIAALKLKSIEASHEVPEFDMPWSRHWHTYKDPKNGQLVAVRVTRESEGRGKFGSEEDHDLSTKALRFSKSSDLTTAIHDQDLGDAKQGASIHPNVQGKSIYWQIFSRYRNPKIGRNNRWDIYFVEGKDKKKGYLAVRLEGPLTENHDLATSPIYGANSDEIKKKIYDFEVSESKEGIVDPKKGARIHPEVQGKVLATDVLSGKRYPKSLRRCRWDVYFVEPGNWDKGLISVLMLDGSESHNPLVPAIRSKSLENLSGDIWQYESSSEFNPSALEAVEEAKTTTTTVEDSSLSPFRLKKSIFGLFGKKDASADPSSQVDDSKKSPTRSSARTSLATQTATGADLKTVAWIGLGVGVVGFCGYMLYAKGRRNRF